MSEPCHGGCVTDLDLEAMGAVVVTEWMQASWTLSQLCCGVVIDLDLEKITSSLFFFKPISTDPYNREPNKPPPAQTGIQFSREWALLYHPRVGLDWGFGPESVWTRSFVHP